MLFRYLFILIIFLPIKAFALIEVDITRGNLSPLPIAVSSLSIDDESKESFNKVLKNKESLRKHQQVNQIELVMFVTKNFVPNIF